MMATSQYKLLLLLQFEMDDYCGSKWKAASNYGKPHVETVMLLINGPSLLKTHHTIATPSASALVALRGTRLLIVASCLFSKSVPLMSILPANVSSVCPEYLYHAI